MERSGMRNRLLCAVPPEERALLLPRLVPEALPLHERVLRAGEPVEALHFVESGTLSMLAHVGEGTQVEVGLVGFEGMVGLPLLLGTHTSPHDALVQLEGEALRLPAPGLRAALQELPALHGLLMRYVDAFHTQVSQFAACNIRHTIVQRLARWVLMTHDRAGGDEFLLTQEFLARMLGVQRPGVTLAVRALTRAGLVRHARGTMEVVDRAGLEAAACGCYVLARDRAAAVLGPPPPPA